jgi:hypothetical protein
MHDMIGLEKDVEVVFRRGAGLLQTSRPGQRGERFSACRLLSNAKSAERESSSSFNSHVLRIYFLPLGMRNMCSNCMEEQYSNGSGGLQQA